MIRKRFLATCILFLLAISFFGIANAGIFGEKAILVVAHEDDEFIFFSSALREVDNVVMSCYPESAVIRQLMINRYPSDIGAHWVALQGLVSHEKAKQIAHNKELREQIVTDEFLKELLREFVEKFDVVITHSPWGEYGHIQHRQIFRVLKELCVEYGKDLWITGLITSAHTFFNTQAQINVPSMVLQTNIDLYHQLKNVYLEAEAQYTLSQGETWWNGRFWTWDRNNEYTPPSYTTYYKMVENGHRIYDTSAVDTIKCNVLFEYQGYCD